MWWKYADAFHRMLRRSVCQVEGQYRTAWSDKARKGHELCMIGSFVVVRKSEHKLIDLPYWEEGYERGGGREVKMDFIPT